MYTENIIQGDIRGLESNFEELKLLLNLLNIPIVALHDCRLGGDIRLCGNSPAGEAALLTSKRVVHTGLRIDTHLHAAVAAIALGKIFTICPIYLTPGIKLSKLTLENRIDQLPKPFLSVGDFNTHSPVRGVFPTG